MITLDNIENIQKECGDSLVKLGSLKKNRHACEKEAESLLNKLYGYHNGTVLFKPTKAKDNQFRLTFEWAKSYFIGCLLYTSPSPRDRTRSRMPSSA